MTSRRASAPRTLAVAIGNTTIFAGTFVGDRLQRPVRLDHGAFGRLDEFIDARTTAAVFCSVVPSLTPGIERLLRHRRLTPLSLSATSPHGLRIGYREPAKLGADRVAAALGARARFPQRPLLVIDFGTATTVTALHRDGTILGGAILPGVSLGAQALGSRTAQLPTVAPARPRRALGRSPAEGIASGVFFGQIGAVREVLARVRAEAFDRADATVVATGGHAPLFAGESLFDELIPHLVLEGLHAFAVASVSHAPSLPSR